MTLGWFEGFGIEAEYMIVDQKTLAVRPIADEVLAQMAGGPADEVELGLVAWSNELVLHVLELKANGPQRELKALHLAFVEALRQMNQRLKAWGAKLLPTAMHPLFDPQTETKLWPHGNREIYQAYDRIFDCRGHGWSNLQSLHINFPFEGDRQFVRLHDAIRLVLPLLPALAASSPLEEGKATGQVDSRLFHYRRNQAKIPAIAGQVVPERVSSSADYQEKILKPIYQAIAPLDPQGILAEEWLNSRGAIARFDRSAIEIRLLDLQECAVADFALAALVISLVQELATGPDALPVIPEQRLAAQLWGAAEQGRRWVIEDPEILGALGLEANPTAVGDLWRSLVDRLTGQGLPLDNFLPQVYRLVQKDSLARRILRGCGEGQAGILKVYGELAQCLEEDWPYEPTA
ncbi:MAG: glutamate-cysteine ligase family protein [bacterium]|nr:glutamate-cysteine ligase family protein [bacterium]